MADWWSIEVLDGEFSALSWWYAHQDPIVESAVTNRVLIWDFHVHSWGLVIELSFRTEDEWERWRALPGVQAALDAVPDPVAGLLIHRGRGGSAGDRHPRRPLPAPGAASARLPLPERPEPLQKAIAVVVAPRGGPAFP